MKKKLSAGILLLLPIFILAQSLPSKNDIVKKMRLVNDYWISQNSNPGNNQWARSAYFTGNMDFYKIYPKEAYIQYADLWAKNNSWGLNGGTSTRNADNQICGQIYIDLYNTDIEKQPSKIAAITASIDNMVNSTKTDDWWWIDALYMAMPVYARLGVLFNDPAYFNKMHTLFTNTKVTRGLFNSSEGLWYRDESFKPPYYTPNGEDSYWSRGNGWVIGALVRVLQLLPANQENRTEYIETFRQMAQSLKNRQRTDGFWNVSLDDPNDFGGPETSGTGFFTYGIAWGINNHLLDSATYYPVVAKAWSALSTVAVQPNGFLGYVQGVGSNPSSSQPVTVSKTDDFGVGAFLLAGSELAKLAQGEMPVPAVFTLLSAVVIDKNNIKVMFNKKIDETTAFLSSNYSINNNITISNAKKETNDSCVILEISDLNFGNYKLEVSNIESIEGFKVEAGDSKSFSYSGILSVTASESQPGTSNTPDKTIDFDYSTRWSAEGIGQWIQFDLGEEKMVRSVDLAFYNGNIRNSYFIIQLSSDGTNYTEVFNGISSGTTAELENYDFTDKNARYVKIIGNGNSQSLWNSITEARINSKNLTSSINNTLDNYFNIFPNPLRGKILNINSETDYKKIAIFDLTGRKLFESENNISQLTDLNLTSGLYYIMAYYKNNHKSKLLIVE
jgi:rhamnogalacturonyl hydrolase YesR